jgi:hypothetical protein
MGGLVEYFPEFTIDFVLLLLNNNTQGKEIE